MTTTLYPDLAHYNWPLRLDGVPLVVYKATQGTSFVDQTYALAKAEAAARGTRFAAYHWLDSTDAAAQAKHCFSVVGPHVPLMIDDEQQRIVVAHTLAFVAAFRALGGIVHLEYAPAWVWRNSSEPDLRPFAEAGLLVVSSSYGAPYSDTGRGWTGYGGIVPTIWQYTDHQAWHGKYVDFNAFRGTADELWSLLTDDGGSDMDLTDKLPGTTVTVAQALMGGYLAGVRTDYLANKAGLVDKLNQVLAAEAANPTTTVTMSDADAAALAGKVADLVEAHLSTTDAAVARLTAAEATAAKAELDALSAPAQG